MIKSQIINNKSQINSKFKLPKLWRLNLGNLAFGNLRLFVIWILVLGFLAGCSVMKEGTKGFLGVSTKALEDNRESGLKKKFNFGYNNCSEKVIKALKESGAYIYSQDPKKGMIAVYISTEDTTPVGIFLTKIDVNNTEVEVVSPSSYGKETIAKIVFDELLGVVKTKKDKDKEKEKGLF